MSRQGNEVVMIRKGEYNRLLMIEARLLELYKASGMTMEDCLKATPTTTVTNTTVDEHECKPPYGGWA